MLQYANEGEIECGEGETKGDKVKVLRTKVQVSSSSHDGSVG